MKYLVLTAVLTCSFACTENVGVTDGTPKTPGIGPEELRLQNNLVPQCRSICQMISNCPAAAYGESCDCFGSETPTTSNGSVGAANGDASVADTTGTTGTTASGKSDVSSDGCTCTPIPANFDECFEDCLSQIGGRFLNNGETCAKAGADTLECVAQLTCSAFSSGESGRSDVCGQEAAMDLCPTPDDTGTIYIPGTDVTQDAVVPTSTKVGRITACSESAASAKAPTVNGVGPNEQLCDQTAMSCSDGHTYRVTCATNANLEAICQCIFDGHPQLTFQEPGLLSADYSNSACNYVSVMSERCGWSIVTTAVR